MEFRDILDVASKQIAKSEGDYVGSINILKPLDVESAKNLIKIISKLSPFIGNMIEFEMCKKLNEIDWRKEGRWIKQDPGFPDLYFVSSVDKINPGIEIKTWFPLSTEITARFRESISHFKNDQTSVVLIAWIPEKIFYGKPKIIGVWIGSAQSLALARDKHYNNPPDYIVFEPEDTTGRTSNLQQTNTNGYKFQGSPKQFSDAENEVKKWGKDAKVYQPTHEYQEKLKSLLRTYPYRLDTNFSKIDRIEHKGLEDFKTRILSLEIEGHNIIEWSSLLTDNEKKIKELIQEVI